MHTISLEIPVAELGGDQQVVGVYATTSRQQMSVLSSGAGSAAPALSGGWVQVARQGNPLFNEVLVAIQDKDLYSRTKPSTDASLFQKYASTPELAALVNAITFGGMSVAPTTNRTDLVGIFIPDMLRVDLSTGPGPARRRRRQLPGLPGRCRLLEPEHLRRGHAAQRRPGRVRRRQRSPAAGPTAGATATT